MGRKKKNWYWMAVTPDRYEYPILVCDTVEELADALGIQPCSVLTEIYGKGRNRGVRKNYYIRRVIRE